MPTIRNAEVPGVIEGLGQVAKCKLPVAGKLRVVKVTRALQAHWQDVLAVRDELVREIAAPPAIAGWIQIFGDSADGDLKVRFPNGTIKTIQTN